VRWTDPASWHLTLVFCGAVAPQHQALLVPALRQAAAPHRPLSLALAGGGRFDHRVLWAGVAGDRSALVALAAATGAAAAAAGLAVEERAYRPHLTVARGRPGADLAPPAAALASYAGPMWVADGIVLLESVLGAGPAGAARHLTVETIPLG